MTSPMKKKVGLGLLLVVLVLVGKTLVDAGALREVKPHGLSACTKVEGVTGAEDAVFDLTWARVILSSQDFRTMESASPAPGHLFLYDPVTKAAPTPLPMDFTGAFHPHGLGLYTGGDGERRLFVVNHPTFQTSVVEIFSLEDGPSLKHLRTVSDPLLISLNDVEPVGSESFYVTNDAGTVNGTAGRVLETFLQLPWSSVAYFDGTKVSLAAKGFTYANGVALSHAGKVVLVSESTGRNVYAFARDEATGALSELAHLTLPAGLDNFSSLGDNRFLLAGHPKLLAFLGHAKDATKRSPSQLFRVRFDLGRQAFELEDVAVDDGALLSGSSVGLPLPNERLLVGSVFEHHILDCPAL